MSKIGISQNTLLSQVEFRIFDFSSHASTFADFQKYKNAYRNHSIIKKKEEHDGFMAARQIIVHQCSGGVDYFVNDSIVALNDKTMCSKRRANKVWQRYVLA